MDYVMSTRHDLVFGIRIAHGPKKFGDTWVSCYWELGVPFDTVPRILQEQLTELAHAMPLPEGVNWLELRGDRDATWRVQECYDPQRIVSWCAEGALQVEGKGNQVRSLLLDFPQIALKVMPEPSKSQADGIWVGLSFDFTPSAVNAHVLFVRLLLKHLFVATRGQTADMDSVLAWFDESILAII